MRHRQIRAFTISELLVCLVAMVVLASVMLRSLAYVSSSEATLDSFANLITLGVAHETYAADWNGRQLSLTVDDLSTYGSTMIQAMLGYSAQNNNEEHPWIYLGVGQGAIHGFPPAGSPVATPNSISKYWPINFSGEYQGSGHFRIPNCMALHQYVGGRFYDEPYYTPTDPVVYKSVSWLFDLPYGYVPSGITGGIKWSSYCLSPAARFDPAVMRAPSAGGWQSPFDIPTGFKTPSFSQAAYPDLKTQMIEHHWNQNPPSMCNPSIPNGTYNGCEPWYFNHGYDSAPVALFYDGSVRQLLNSEVIAADEAILKQTNGVDGLWSRDTPMGELGYFGQFSYDGTLVSHHILTTDGILGRDTLSP